MDKQKLKVNKNIKADRVFLIDQDGQKLGEFLLFDALKVADEKELDLVEVGPGARPTCKLMDLGKFLYQQQKNEKEQKKKSAAAPKTKELKIRPLTDIHDLQVREKQARNFLSEGDKVKITMMFRGREHAHHDIGRQKCLDLAQHLQDVAQIESPPILNGRDMIMFLVPK